MWSFYKELEHTVMENEAVVSMDRGERKWEDEDRRIQNVRCVG
jgi:hypothetical protein